MAVKVPKSQQTSLVDDKKNNSVHCQLQKSRRLSQPAMATSLLMFHLLTMTYWISQVQSPNNKWMQSPVDSISIHLIPMSPSSRSTRAVSPPKIQFGTFKIWWSVLQKAPLSTVKSIQLHFLDFGCCQICQALFSNHVRIYTCIHTYTCTHT